MPPKKPEKTPYQTRIPGRDVDDNEDLEPVFPENVGKPAFRTYQRDWIPTNNVDVVAPDDDTDEVGTTFKIGDTVMILPPDQKPYKNTKPSDMWHGEILSMKANPDDQNDVWMEVQWYISLKEARLWYPGTKATLFNCRLYAQNEYFKMPMQDVVHFSTIDAMSDLKYYDEMALRDSNAPTSNALFWRFSLDHHGNVKRDSKATCTCAAPYAPPKDHQHLCPKCLVWYHERCLQKSKALHNSGKNSDPKKHAHGLELFPFSDGMGLDEVLSDEEGDDDVDMEVDGSRDGEKEVRPRTCDRHSDSPMNVDTKDIDTDSDTDSDSDSDSDRNSDLSSARPRKARFQTARPTIKPSKNHLKKPTPIDVPQELRNIARHPITRGLGEASRQVTLVKLGGIGGNVEIILRARALVYRAKHKGIPVPEGWAKQNIFRKMNNYQPDSDSELKRNPLYWCPKCQGPI